VAGKTPLTILCAVGTIETTPGMAYLKDLSNYSHVPDNRSATTTLGWFSREGESGISRPSVKNIGRLARGHEFGIQITSEEILSLICDYCAIFVNPMRGVHECSFCPDDKKLGPVTLQEFKYAERSGRRILLGSAEIRVFAASGDIYAAPTLIYHYVSVHHYSPPSEFVEAMRSRPRPSTPEYFRLLRELGLEYNVALRKSI
jgi:hypothetical protein